MSTDLLAAFLAFAFVSSVTPGPNNLMLMASGANFGFARTIPHMLGIAGGFSFMIVLVGMGLMQVFDTWPVSYTILKAVSIAYLGWLAWRIATASGPGRARTGARPFGFLQAAAFQWVNPKAWAMALTAITAYAPGRGPAAILFVAAVFGAVNLPTVSTWAFLGRSFSRFLTDPVRLRAFNIVMAVLLVASVWPVLRH